MLLMMWSWFLLVWIRVIDVDEDLLMKHYVQFVLGSEHAD